MDWVSFDEIKKTVTLQMAIEHYGIPLRRVEREHAPGKMPACQRTDRRRATRVSPPPSPKAWAVPGHASRNRASNRAAASAATCSISSPRWNSVPSGMRRSNCKSGFWFRLRATPRAGWQGTSRGNFRGQGTGAELVSEKDDGVGESESNKPLTFTLQNIDHTHPYLNERGLTEETAQNIRRRIFSRQGIDA